MQQSNLLVADPKALQYIFHTSGYRFPKTGDMHHFMNSLFGPGIVTVDGKIIRFLDRWDFDLSSYRRGTSSTETYLEPRILYGTAEELSRFVSD